MLSWGIRVIWVEAHRAQVCSRKGAFVALAVAPKHNLWGQTLPVLWSLTDSGTEKPMVTNSFLIVLPCWHSCCRNWSLLPGEVRGESPHSLTDSTETQEVLLQHTSDCYW